MYKHYETSDDVFVDREEHIEWMNNALERCKKKSVVLHLKGIGGIGKSSLLNHWVNTQEKTIRLDCEQYSEFYQRLNMLAKGAVLQGVKLQRFDILWQIRQRFVEGVEPVKEEGREWAKEVVMAIPFIGSLASIGSAINAVGAKVTPKLKGKYGAIGKWLQETLGKNHIEQLLEILWKDPRRAEFLYLSAFLEDINTRDNPDDPILFLLDHFEYVDDIKAQWKYQQHKINETQLWTIFLSNLTNCVGVLASRQSAAKIKTFEVEESELTELDKESCLEMMELQGVEDETLQQIIVSVSGGNPFVIDAICDMINTSDVTLADIEDLRADTLSEVRLKVWRRLFREAKGLHKLINRAGIVPYFNERIMRIISPEMTPDSWDRLRRLSFINIRSDGTFVLHDLAEDIVRAELDNGLSNLVDEVSDLLEKKYNEESDITLLGLALSVRALVEPKRVLNRFNEEWANLSWRSRFTEGLALCDSIRFPTEETRAYLRNIRSHFLTYLDRLADGEHEARDALDVFEKLETITEVERKRYLALSYQRLGTLFLQTRRDAEIEEAYKKGIDLMNEVISETIEDLPPGRMNLEQSGFLWWYAGYLKLTRRLHEAEAICHESMKQWKIFESKNIGSTSAWDRRFFDATKIHLADTYLLLGKLQQAQTICHTLPETVENPFIITQCYGILAESLRLSNRPLEALEWSNKDLGLIDEFKENLGVVAGTHLQFIGILHNLGRYSEALVKSEELVNLVKEASEKSPEGYSRALENSLRKQAILLSQTGKIAEAEEIFNESLRLRNTMKYMDPFVNDSQIARILNDRGILLFKTGRHLKAEKDFKESLELARRVVDRFPEFVWHILFVNTIQNNLGSLYLATGRHEEAREAFKEALTVYEEISKLSDEIVKAGQATVLNNLGAYLSSNGKFSEAEKMLKESQSIRRELEERGVGYHRVRVGSTINNLGFLHMKRGDFSQALEMFGEATDLIERINSESALDCKDDLKITLRNQYIAISKIDTNKSDDIMKRLRGLGVKKVESESLILDVMESS